MCAGVYLFAAVIDAIADHRPAVVLATFGDVNLIAPARAVLVHPPFAAYRVQGAPFRIAMAVAPDFRFGARSFDEGIVRRHRTVRPNADDLAEMIAKVLRLVALTKLFTERQKQVSVLRLHDAAAKVHAAT